MSIVYKDNRVSLFTHYANPKKHSHFAKHIIIGDEEFECIVNGRKIFSEGIIIQSNAKHTAVYKGNNLEFLMLIDETSDLSKEIDRLYLNEEDFALLPKEKKISCPEKLRIIQKTLRNR